MRRLGTAGAVLLTTVLCVGMSAGPATAENDTATTTSSAGPATAEDGTAATTSSAEPDVSPPVATTPPEPPPAPAEVELPDLVLTAWFDKPAYLAHEQITARVRVTNVGSAAVNQAVVTSTGPFSNHRWEPFHPSGRSVEPGQSVDGSATGLLTSGDPELRLVITVAALGGEQDANPADNEVAISVPVTFVRGSLRGFVYGDDDGDRVADPGEELAGVVVRTSDNRGTASDVTTGPDGRFVFPDLPGGSYWTTFTGPGWHFTSLNAVVDGTDGTDVVVRGVRQVVSEELTASLRFTRQEYRENDVAHLDLTLTNNSGNALTGLTAACNTTTATELGLGDLGSGAILPAGASRTFPVTARITANARTLGHVEVRCTIGAPPSLNGYVTTSALARVPGGVAPLVTGSVQVFRYKPLLGLPVGDPLPGVKVYLTDHFTGVVVARAVTDANGRYEFAQVPAGVYRFGIVGPWEYSDTNLFVVHDGENGQNYPWTEWFIRRVVFVVPGADRPDPDAVPPGGAAAPPAESGSPRLAVTGADVTWLGLGGLLTLTAGCALVLAAARRRA